MVVPSDYPVCYETPEPTEEGSRRLRKMLMRLEEAREQEQQLAAASEKAKRNREQIEQRDIPELMDELGVSEIVLSEGVKIKVRDRIHASPLKARVQEAFAWLRRIGEGGAIRRTGKFPVPRNEEEAHALRRELESRGLAYEEDERVHPQTFARIAREALSRGEEIPDSVSLTNVRVAEIRHTRGK